MTEGSKPSEITTAEEKEASDRAGGRGRGRGRGRGGGRGIRVGRSRGRGGRGRGRSNHGENESKQSSISIEENGTNKSEEKNDGGCGVKSSSGAENRGIRVRKMGRSCRRGGRGRGRGRGKSNQEESESRESLISVEENNSNKTEGKNGEGEGQSSGEQPRRIYPSSGKGRGVRGRSGRGVRGRSGRGRGGRGRGAKGRGEKGKIETNNHRHLKIGILGAALIARKNVAAIQNENSLCKVTAIASRSEGKANQFVKQHCRGKITIFSGEEAYQELLSSSLVDAVYMPLPTSMHKEWVIKALRSGKHVLVEKPVATNVKDFQEMQNVANEEQRYLLDGTMFVHNPRTQHLLEYINATKSNEFGKVLRINSDFTFLGDDNFLSNNIRTQQDGDPLGCLGDLAWYSVRMALLVMKEVGYAPEKVQVTFFKLNSLGVPLDATGLVHFSSKEKDDNDSKGILSFHCSFLHPLRQRVEICGSNNQTITMTDFVIPRKGSNSFQLCRSKLTDCDIFMETSTRTIQSKNDIDVPQETLMWRHLSQTSRAMEEPSAGESSDLLVASQEMSEMSQQTQVVILALIDSIREGGKEICLQDLMVMN